MYKGTVLQYLRKYIKDLQADQLESYVLAGELTLHAIELEPEAISDWISDIVPYTVEIERVFCSKVDIKIPWAALRTKPVQIAVHQMEITLLVHDFREQDWAVQQATIQKNRLIQSRIVELDEVFNPEKALKKMELSWIDYVSAGMQIRAEFCSIILKSLSGSRLPPTQSGHSCQPSSVPDASPPSADPITAFKVEIEGLFIAPCHHQSGWSVSYVETPEQVYQYDAQEKLLRLSRLITLKSFSVNSGSSGRSILTHSPGFRMRMTSEFTCVNLIKRKRRFCIPPFPSRSNKALWMDRVNVSTKCSCELAAFYAMIQDLTAPTMVPPEALTPGNRPCHYTYKERDILTAETEEQLDRLKGIVTDIKRPVVDSSETSSFAGEVLPPLAEPKKPPKIKKKKGIVTSGSVKQDVRKLFAGLAKEVKDNATKAQQQTEKLMASAGKKLFSPTVFSVGAKTKESFQLSSAVGGPLSPIASSREPDDLSPVSEDDQSPMTGASSSIRSRGRMPSRMGSIHSEDSEFFADAISEAGGDANNQPPPEERIVEGHEDAFGMWLGGEAEGDMEFKLSTQLVIVDKINFSSFFHIHLNELVLVTGAVGSQTVSILIKKLDMTSESQTPLTMTQLGTLASFAQFPQLFLLHAQRLTANVVLPSEPVHASTALSVLSLQITVTPPTSSPNPLVTILKLEPKTNGVKSLCIKWKSRTPPPTRLISGMEHGKAEIETGRIQPWEGCIHGVSINGSSSWGVFTDIFNQCMAFSGEWPDPSLDPVMRLRLILREADFVMPESGYKLAFPSGVLIRNWNKKNSAVKFEEILAGFQTLSPIPPIHFSDATSLEPPQASGGFPFDGAFCSCICGQESCSWSWALPTTASHDYPAKIKLGDSAMGSTGTVAERTWRRALVQSHKSHMYVPTADFRSLLEAKLRLAEQDVVVDHLRDQYNSLMEEITKRNSFLKERWAADAVQTTSRENVVNVLTQKVCALESVVRELTEEKESAERVAREVRSVFANEMTSVRKELLEETQRLSHKLDHANVVQESLNDALVKKDRELDQLKQQLEFLLGLGVRASNNVVTQTE